MEAALRIILSDPNVKAVMFNIFGGITRGDDVARGIVKVLGQMKPDVPMVVRLVGTNAEEGRRILEEGRRADLGHQAAPRHEIPRRPPRDGR